jgi:uncharacterized protein YkwD
MINNNLQTDSTIQIFTDLTFEIAREINKVRTNPSSYINILENYLNNNFKDSNNPKIFYKKNGNRILLDEGKSAVSDAINYLKNASAVDELQINNFLGQAAVDHVIDIGVAGIFSHIGTNNSTVISRVEKYCEWDFGLAENIVFNECDPEEIVAAMIVDDGNSDRSQRLNLFNKHFKYIGIAAGDHFSESNNSVVCLFASNIREIKSQPFIITTKENENEQSEFQELLPIRTNFENSRNHMQEVDKDAPDDAVSVSYCSKQSIYNGKEVKTNQKIYSLKNGGSHIVEVIYDD